MKKIVALVFLTLLFILSARITLGVDYGKDYYDSVINKYSSPYLETLNSISSQSPYSSYFQNNNERVVTSSGSLNITAIDLVLPGRHGFDLVIKRIYDSDLAQEQGVAVYDFIWGKESHAPEYKGPHTPPVKTFSRGWTLNIPWIETNTQGTFIHLPEGQYVKVTNPNTTFEYHDGVNFSYFNKVLTFANGMKYEFNNSGRPTRFYDSRYSDAVITYNYTGDGSRIQSIVDSLGRTVTFNYENKKVGITVPYQWGDKTVPYSIDVITSITVASKTVTYNYDGDKLYQVTDPKNRVTTYDYERHSLTKGTVVKWKTRTDTEYHIYPNNDTNQPVSPQFDTWVYENDVSTAISTTTITPDRWKDNYEYYETSNKYGFYFEVLNKITYPSKAESVYKYDKKEDYVQNSKDVPRFGTRILKSATYQGYFPRTVGNQTEYYYYYKAELCSDEVTTKSYGSKLVVKSHSCAEQNTTYNFTMNDRSTNDIWSAYAILPNSYVKSVEVIKDGQLIKETFKQVYPSGWDDEMKYSYNYDQFYLKDNYKGSLLSSKTIKKKDQTSGNYVEVEKIDYSYDLAIKALKTETRQRNSQVICQDSYTNDSWGNIKSHTNSVTKLEESMEYYDNGTFKNLLKTHVVKNYDPVKDSYSQVTTTYGEYLKGKPTDVTVSYDSKSLLTHYEYYDNGNLKKTIQPNGLTTEMFYNATALTSTALEAFPEKIETSGIKGVDENKLKYTTRFGYDLTTGLKKWEMDPRGYVTYYDYDILDRLIQVVLPDDDDIAYQIPELNFKPVDNPRRDYIYDDTNNSCLFINENRQKTFYQFNGLGKVSDVISYLNGQELKTHYEYDSEQRIKEIINPRGYEMLANINDFKTSYEYDGFNRVTKITFPQEETVRLEYDDLNNQITVFDPYEHKIAVEKRDWADRLIEATQTCWFEETVSSERLNTFQYDSLGKMVKISQPRLTTIHGYDSLGHLMEVNRSSAVGLVLPGETNFSVFQNLNSYGTQVSYDYDLMGNRTLEVSANGNSLSQVGNNKVDSVYDELGRLLKVTSKSINYKENVPCEVVSVTKYYYDEAGNKVKMVDANNEEWNYTYSAKGLLLSEKDPLGNITRYRYDPQGNKIATIDPRNQEEAPICWWGNFNYGTTPESGTLVLTDQRTKKNYTTWYLYDDLNRLVRTVNPTSDGKTQPINPYIQVPDYDNEYIGVEYDKAGNKISVRDRNGIFNSYTYYPRNWLETVSDSEGIKEKYEYDKNGNATKTLTKQKDNTWVETTKSYDSLGQIRRVISPKQEKEEYKYDEVGNKIESIDGNQHTTYFTYNEYGWLIGVQDPMMKNTSYRYDPNGNRLAMIDPKKLVTILKYDEMNRLIETIDSTGMSDKYAYDCSGNRKEMIDRRGTKWTYEYYGNNLLHSLFLSGDGQTYAIAYEYDTAGNRTKVSDNSEIANAINSNFDSHNRLTSVQRNFDTRSYTTNYLYNNIGLLEQIQYPGTTSTISYKYNTNRQLEEVVGFTKPQGITYNPDGLTSEIKYLNGVNTAFGYDLNRRIQDIDVTRQTDGSTATSDIIRQSYNYDAVGNATDINDKVANLASTFTYYSNNWLKSESVTGKHSEETDGIPGTVQQDYFGEKPLDFITTQAEVKLDYNSTSVGLNFGADRNPSIKKIQLIPDAAHQTNRIVVKGIEIFVSQENTVYTSVPRTQWDYFKGTDGTITIELKEPIKCRCLKIHSVYNNTDGNGNPVDKSTFVNELAKMLRVYEEIDGSKISEYSYDDAGNRVLRSVTLVNCKDYLYKYYPNSNRLLSDGEYGYVYDAAGNLIEKGNKFIAQNDNMTFTLKKGTDVEYWQYKYDLMNRLTEVWKNGGLKPVVEYGYDPDGFRVVKTIPNGETTHYVFDGTEPIFEKQIKSGKIKSYVYALGKHLARVDGVIGDTTAKVYYYHTDHVGSIRKITNLAGTVVWDANYAAFGRQCNQSGSITEFHSFTGKELDPDTGLYYFNARWYDSELGRFISEDPKGDPNNPNLYTYCANNPLIFIDPTGETSEVVEKVKEVGFDVYDILTFGMASGQQRELNKYHQETASKGEKPTFLGELGSSLVGCGKGLVDTFNPIPNIEKAYTTGDPVEGAVAGLKIAGLYGAGSSTAEKVTEPLKKIINSAKTKVDDAIQVMSSETGSFNISGFTTGAKEVVQASKLPLVRKGTKEWQQAVETIRNGGKSNFRVESSSDAKALLQEARGSMNRYKQYSTTKYNKGYEMHPNESHTQNASQNNLGHVKWKDWNSKENSGVGHIFFNKPN